MFPLWLNNPYLMQALDDKTLSAVALLTSLLLPLVLLGIGQMTSHSQATRIWTRGVAMYSLGFLLIALRNVIPDLASIVVANCLFVMGYGELLQGLKLFFNRPVSRRWMVYVVPLFAALLFMHVNTPGGQEVRVIATSFLMCCLSFAIAAEFYRAAMQSTAVQHASNAGERRVLLVFCAVFAISATAMGARGTIVAIATQGVDSTLMLKLVVSTSFVLAIFVNFILAAGLPLLVSRRIQRDLFASEASLRKAEEVGGLGTLVADLRTLAFTTNSVLVRMLGLAPEQRLTVQTWQALLHPDDRTRAREVLDAVLKGRAHTAKNEYRIVRPDNGEERWLSVSSEVSTDTLSGEKVLMSSMRDITDLKQAELAAVRARELADQASNAKSSFLATMSHEIRTPMNAILGLLNLLQTTPLTARQRDYASKTEGAAQSLLGLLNDILDFSKVEAGKMTLESEPFHLERLLRNLAVVLSANVGARDVEVLFDIDPALPTMLRGDAMRLQQVLINLGGNAIKLTPRGQVVLSLRKVDETADTVTIAFAVQDSGIGIAPQHQAHIFSGFSQAEDSTTRRFGGTGLGLAISQRLVNMMGGAIELTSAEGEGSTFAFALQLPKVAQIAQPLPAPAPQRVLIVDDNPTACALIRRMVEAWGWQCDLAHNPEQALALFVGQPDTAQLAYSLVLMDWHLAHQDGWETTRQLLACAAQHAQPAPAVIMLTPRGNDALAQRSGAEQNMVKGLLNKPFTCGMLQDAWEQASTTDAPVLAALPGGGVARRLQGMRVLVVEDNLLNQQVAEELLSREGALVSMAGNGRLGVEAVAAAKPQFDAVLMDLQMPVLDGYGATQEIRHTLALAHLPVIAMTANALESDRLACIAAGMSEHIGKPFDMDKLVALLLRVTGLRPCAEAGNDHHLTLVAEPPLPQVDGLDLATALNRMSGMRTLYVRSASELVRTLGTVVGDLQRHLAAGEPLAARMLLHTLNLFSSVSPSSTATNVDCMRVAT